MAFPAIIAEEYANIGLVYNYSRSRSIALVQIHCLWKHGSQSLLLIVDVVLMFQKPVPSPQPQYVPVVPAQPFSPTSMRPPAVPTAAFPQAQLMMVAPQQYNMYRGSKPFNKR